MGIIYNITIWVHELQLGISLTLLHYEILYDGNLSRVNAASLLLSAMQNSAAEVMNSVISAAAFT